MLLKKFFSVNVVSVKTINVKGKKKLNKFGKIRKPNWKKAYVCLEDGHTIELSENVLRG